MNLKKYALLMFILVTSHHLMLSKKNKFSAADLQQLAEQAEMLAGIKVSFGANTAYKELNDRCALVEKITATTQKILGANYLAVKNVRKSESALKTALKKTNIKVHKISPVMQAIDVHACAIEELGVDTIVQQSLKQAAHAAREAAKWLAKAQEKLASQPS